MKTSRKTVCLAVITVAFLSVVAAEDSRDEPKDLPEYVGIHRISDDVREQVNKLQTLDLRATYLSSIVSSDTTNHSETENSRKASAIRLLGLLKNTNSISTLISNISFVDVKYGDKPSVDSLAAFGDTAVPHLLHVLENPSATSTEYQCAVKALMLIKHAKPRIREWVEFMNEQKGRLSDKAWARLWRYGSVF